MRRREQPLPCLPNVIFSRGAAAAASSKWGNDDARDDDDDHARTVTCESCGQPA